MDTNVATLVKYYKLLIHSADVSYTCTCMHSY